MVVEMAVGADGAVERSRGLSRAGAQPRQARLQQRRRLAGRRRRRRRRGLAAVPGLDEQLAPAGPRRAGAAKRAAGARRAEARNASRRGRCSTATRWPIMRPDEQNRAKELIEDFMIAANGVDRAVSRAARASRRSAACCGRRSAGTASSQLAAELGGRLPADPERAGARRFLDRRRQHAIRSALPTCRCPSSSCSAPANTRSSFPGDEREGHFGLAVRDYTHSTAPNRRFPDLVTQRLLKAALDGRQPALQRRRARGARRATARSRRTMPTRSSGRCASRRPRCCSVAHRRALRRHRHRRLGQGHLGAHLAVRRRRARSCAASRASTSATGSRVELVRTDVERGFIDFARRPSS